MNCWMGRSFTPFARRISSSRPGVGTPHSQADALLGYRPLALEVFVPAFGLAPGTTPPGSA
jgi:hypothetical protein